MRVLIGAGVLALVVPICAIADETKNVDANKLFMTLRTVQKVDIAFRSAAACRMRSNITAEIARQRDAGKTLADVLAKIRSSEESKLDAAMVFASSESANKLSDKVYSECELAARKEVLKDVQM